MRKIVNPNPSAVFIPYEEIYEDGLANIDLLKQAINSLSRTDTLFWCARMNLILADPNLDDKSKQQCILHLFFNPEQIQKVNEFVESHGDADHVLVAHRGTVLELIRWACIFCSDHPNDGTTFNKPEIREIFARTLLMANDIWGKKVYGETPFAGDSLEDKRRSALASFRRAIAETSFYPRPMETLARGLILFQDYMPRHFDAFLSQFQRISGMGLKEYYLCICTIMAHYMNSETKSGVGKKENTGIFNLDTIRKSAPHVGDLFQKYFSIESLSPDDLKTALRRKPPKDGVGFESEYDFKSIRERPILRAVDGRMIILDPVFFSERASVGPLFQLLRDENNNNLFSAFGYAFEDYVGGSFRRIYPDSEPSLAKRLHRDVRESRDGGIQIADFILDDVVDIVLIETKAVWIRDAEITPNEPEKLIQHLRAKYGGVDKEKGYKQLAKTIDKIASSEWSPVAIDVLRAKRIFPVLLVHDHLLDAPVFGHILAEEFRDHLKPDSVNPSGWLVKGSYNVAPLIVMTIDDLESLESSLQKFRLVDLLTEYSKQCPDRMVSLHNFLSVNSKRFPLIHNRNIASRCSTILAECLHLVFPNQQRLGASKLVGKEKS